MRIRVPYLALLAIVFAGPGLADAIVTKRTVQANTVLMAHDLEVLSNSTEGELDLASVIGMEARKVLFKGQPIGPRDIARPALVERNQVVLLVFNQGGLSIETEGRALDRGRVGDVIRVMNLSSRSTVSGKVDHLGAIQVGK